MISHTGPPFTNNNYLITSPKIQAHFPVRTTAKPEMKGIIYSSGRMNQNNNMRTTPAYIPTYTTIYLWVVQKCMCNTVRVKRPSICAHIILIFFFLVLCVNKRYWEPDDSILSPNIAAPPQLMSIRHRCVPGNCPASHKLWHSSRQIWFNINKYTRLTTTMGTFCTKPVGGWAVVPMHCLCVYVRFWHVAIVLAIKLFYLST